MKILLVGYGGSAATHAAALKEQGHTLVAVVGPNIEGARRFAEIQDVAYCGQDLDRALQEIPCDVVHVTSPPAYHQTALSMALKAGKHVVSEKPLALTPEEGQHLLAQAQKRGLVHAVCFNQRYQPVILTMRQKIAQDQIGLPRLISGSYRQSFHLLPAPYGWRYRPEAAGPLRAVSEIGSHWFDLVRFLLGQEFVSVSASFLKAHPERRLLEGTMYPAPEKKTGQLLQVDSEDAAVISFRLSDGGLGQVFLSEISAGYLNRLEIEVNGDRGSLGWQSDEATHLRQNRDRTSMTAGAYKMVGFESTFKALFEDVYRVIEKGGSGSFASFADGVQNLAITAAIERSAAADGRQVAVGTSLSAPPDQN